MTIDFALAIAATVALVIAAGPVISIVQERFLANLNGTQALIANVLISLAFACVGTFKSGFLGILPVPHDLVGYILNVTLTTTAIAASCKAAFELIVKPVRDPARPS